MGEVQTCRTSRQEGAWITNSCTFSQAENRNGPIDIYAGDRAGCRKVRARQTLTCQKASARVLGFPSKRRWQDVMDNPRVRAKSVASPDRAKPRLNGVEEERETGKTNRHYAPGIATYAPFPEVEPAFQIGSGSTGPGAPQGVSCGSNDRGRSSMSFCAMELVQRGFHCEGGRVTPDSFFNLAPLPSHNEGCAQ